MKKQRFRNFCFIVGFFGLAFVLASKSVGAIKWTLGIVCMMFIAFGIVSTHPYFGKLLGTHDERGQFMG